MADVTRRTVIAAAGLALGTPVLAANSSRDLSLSDVMARHTSAVGGENALRTARSKAVDLQIIEKQQIISAHYRCNKAPGFRIDIFDRGKHVFCEGLDKDGPWIWPGDAPRARQAVADAKRTGIEGIEFNIYGLGDFVGLGNRLSLDGREEIGGVNYYVVRIALKDSYQTFVYIDPNSWMISRRRDFRSNHPDVNQTKQRLETQFGDFRRVSGIMNAFIQHQVDLGTGKINQVQIVDRMEYNNKDGVPDRSKRNP